jgi:ADP-heptose:LPS heptosyltransferase
MTYPTLEPHATVLPTAVGDTCAILPVLREVHDNYKGLDYTFFVPDHLYRFVRALAFEAGLLHSGSNVKVRHDRYRAREQGKYAGRRYHGNTDITNLRRHMTEAAFITLLDASITDLQPSAFEYLESSKRTAPIGDITKRYIAVAATQQYAVRAMPRAAALSLHYQAALNGYEIVWVGAGKAERFAVGPNDLDMVNQTKDIKALFDLLRAQNVCGFIGPDCGIGHVASCVAKLPVFTYYTTVDPKHRRPARPSMRGGRDMLYQVDVVAGVDCAGCQTKAVFRYDHDYRTCVERPEETDAPRCSKNSAWTEAHKDELQWWFDRVSANRRLRNG